MDSVVKQIENKYQHLSPFLNERSRRLWDATEGYRNRLWKLKLQEFSDETRQTLHVCHFPPGTSKWNKIEHRLFCHITMNWRGRPLTNLETVINLISNTTTRSGLAVHAQLDANLYPTGIQVTDKQFNAIVIERCRFHGEWNYRIVPRKTF